MTMLFDEFDRLFQRLSRSFDLEGRPEGPARPGSLSGPLYYGYAVTVGPDGRPVVQEYGNVPAAAAAQPGAPAGREPPVDTIVDEKDNVIKLVAEMPGVEKGDIRVAVAEDGSVDISAERGTKTYRARVPVKDGVDPDSGRATYRNGVLEVSFKRIPPKPAGKTLEVG